VTLMREW